MKIWALFFLVFALGFLTGFILHAVLTNRRLTRRGFDPRRLLE